MTTTWFSAVLAASLFIPEANDRTLQSSPLEHGEAAYIDTKDGYAHLVIGGNDGKPLTCMDATTMHGVSYERLDAKKISISPGEGVTYSNGMYWAANAVGVYYLYVQCPSDVEIESLDYEYTASMPSEFVEVPNGRVSHVFNGNTATIIMERTAAAGIMNVRNIAVRRVQSGSPEYINELTERKFLCADEMGTFELGQLRKWAQNLHQGNLGKDWSRYKAERPVRLDGNDIILSPSSRLGLSAYADTQMVFRVSSHKALTVTAPKPNETIEGNISIVKFTRTATGVDIQFTTTIPSFNITRLSVVCGDMGDTDTWVDIPYSYDSSTSTLSVACGENDTFFRLLYGEVLMAECRVDINAPLHINNALYLKGEDSIVYRITVNNGLLTATAVQ